MDSLVLMCYKSHRKAIEVWEHGGIVEHWKDENGALCIRYQSGVWWHYAISGKNVTWW